MEQRVEAQQTLIKDLCTFLNTNNFKNDIILYTPLAKYNEDFLELIDIMKKHLLHDLRIYPETPAPGNKIIQLSQMLKEVTWIIITSHLDFICKSERPLVYVYL